jgi:hypothetical protein
MYYDYDPNAENDFDDVKRKGNTLDDFKRNDKDFFCVQRKIRNRNNPIKLEYYRSGPNGTSIRNAITGERYRGILVGSKEEDSFFKVKICNGETGREGVTLFYETPEAYERHQFLELSKEAKEKWLEKKHSTSFRKRCVDEG